MLRMAQAIAGVIQGPAQRRPTPPHPPTSETLSSGKRMKCIKGARNGRPGLGTTNSFLASDPPPAFATPQWPGMGRSRG